jgi:hypothetical protein
MKWFNGNRMRLVVVGIVAALIIGGGSARADFTFGEPTIVEGPINEDYRMRFIGCITADNLEIYFDQHIGTWNSPTRWDIVVSTRNSTDELWSLPMSVGATVNDGSFNYCPSISNDGLKLYFDSGRSGGHGRSDIWVTTRPHKNANWGTPVNLGPPINTSSHDGYPFISSDGRELYFSTNRPGGHGGWDIWVAKRQMQDDNWGTPENLGPLVNKSGDEGAPCLSSDGLKMFFDNGDDMFITQRKSATEPWQAPVRLDEPFNYSGREDLSPRVSPDGRTLYFTSRRPAVYKLQGKGWHVFEAPIIPIVDLNSDGFVDALDMCVMVEHWGESYPLCDIGPTPLGDGIVDVQDLIVLAEHLFEEVYDPTLTAHWKLDETEGMVVTDSAGDNSGYALGDPIWQPDGGQVGGAIELDGIDDYVSTPYILSPTDGDFSVFAWIRGGVAGQVILSQEGGANWLMTNSIDGSLKTDLKQPAIPNRNPIPPGPPLTSSIVVTDGDWHRVGFVRNGSDRILYVDDIEVVRDTAAYLKSAGRGLYIGAGSSLEPRTFWSGLIDDVRIYNRAVSP